MGNAFFEVAKPNRRLNDRITEIEFIGTKDIDCPPNRVVTGSVEFSANNSRHSLYRVVPQFFVPLVEWLWSKKP